MGVHKVFMVLLVCVCGDDGSCRWVVAVCTKCKWCKWCTQVVMMVGGGGGEVYPPYKWCTQVVMMVGGEGCIPIVNEAGMFL